MIVVRARLMVAAGVTAASVVTGVPVTAAVAAPVATSSLVVGLTSAADAAAVSTRLGGSLRRSRPVGGLRAFVVEVPASAQAAVTRALRDDPAVRYVEPDGVAVGMGVVTPADPLRDWDQYGLDGNRVPAAWSWTTGSSDVTVAVVDSGVTANEDLDDGRLLPGYDVVDDDEDASDDQGHGTLIAGAIAGEANNNIGGAGVCWQCRILPVKVLKPTTSGGTTGSYADIAAGIVWAADHGADIINVANGGPTDSLLLREAVAHAVAAGALVVAAAGDSASTQPRYPAAIESVIAVGGTALDGRTLQNSNTNPPGAPWIDLVAVGSRFGLDEHGTRTWMSGSSAATSLISGTAALALTLRPDATAGDVRQTLITRSKKAHPTWGGVPALDASAVTRAFGPPDTTAPLVQDIGLPVDGTPACGCFRRYEPTIVEDHDIARVDIVIGGAVVATSTTQWPPLILWQPRGLTGPTAVTVNAYDSSGNMGTATGTVTFDTRLSAEFLTPQPWAVVDGITTVTITGDPDIATIIVNGKTIDTTAPGPWTTTVDFSERPTGRWDKVVAILTDRAGNEVTMDQDIGVDHDTPALTLDPRQFPKILHGPQTFTPRFTDSSLVQLTLLVNDKAVATTDWHTNVLTWPRSATLTGTYRLTFRAVDEAGHRSELRRTVVLDNTRPKVAAVTPANKALLRGTFHATATGVTDPAGIKQVNLFVNGTYTGSDTRAPFSVPVRTAGRTGSLKLTWEVFDTVGNKTTVVRTITADNTPPTVTITKAPKNGARVTGTVAVAASAKDTYGVARVQLLVNGKVVATDTAAPYTFKVNTKKQKTTMKIQTRAYDRVGNVRSTTVRTWRRR